jgi:aldehyde:ferredoxin oxidoreductase
MNGTSRVHGYAGKTLRVDLSDGRVSTESSLEYASDFLGSAGIAVKILYDELRSWVTPYDPVNRLVFAAGVLQGTPAPGAAKMTVSTLGPVIGGWATSASDSHFGGQLKHAGYDLLIVSGKAHEPVYLLIDDDRVEIRPAAHLWGKTTSETFAMLREELGYPRLHVLSIGPGGENLVRGACIIHDRERALGRCGTGAVMGSKNLKAIALRGSGSVSVADPERFMRITKELRRQSPQTTGSPGHRKYGTLYMLDGKQKTCGVAYKNFQETRLPDEMVAAIDPRKTIDKYRIGRSSFPGCVIGCGQVLHFTDGRWAGLTTMANQWEVVGALQGKLAVWDPQFMFAANTYANDLGIDVDLIGGAIGWAMECYQRGILTERDTDGLKLNWGDIDVIFELMRKISLREGFGNILAEGCAKAADLVGRDSAYYAMHVKGQDLYEACRGAMGWALGVATSTRGGGHTTGAPAVEARGELDPEKVSRVYGITAEETNPLGYQGKGRMVMFIEALHRMANCLGICHFTTAWSNADAMSLPEMAELYSSATGIERSADDLKTIAMRQLNLEKAFNLRHTNLARKDDMLPPRDLYEPVPTGSIAGWKIDVDKWNVMLDEYYEIHGWDPRTSYPRRETLDRLGLGYVADDLASIGKLGE